MMNHWYYNVRNRETGALVAFRVPIGGIEGKDRQQAQAHIDLMNKITLVHQGYAHQRYELYEEDERRQTSFFQSLST